MYHLSYPRLTPTTTRAIHGICTVLPPLLESDLVTKTNRDITVATTKSYELLVAGECTVHVRAQGLNPVLPAVAVACGSDNNFVTRLDIVHPLRVSWVTTVSIPRYVIRTEVIGRVKIILQMAQMPRGASSPLLLSTDSGIEVRMGPRVCASIFSLLPAVSYLLD